jgi:hypothetical protein
MGGRGAEEKQMKATYIWQMINQVGRHLIIFLIFKIFLWRFCAFLNFKNTIKNFLGQVHVKNFWPKKLREEKTSMSSFPFHFFLGRFSA